MEGTKISANKIITQIMVVFSIDVLFLIIFTVAFGEAARELSSMFALGKAGIPVATLLQFFANSVLIALLRGFFMSENIFKKMTMLWRVIWLLLGAFVITVGFVIVFEWIPMDVPFAWFMFVLCFLLGFGVSMAAMILRTGYQNKKYEKMLSDYKERNKGGEADE